MTWMKARCLRAAFSNICAAVLLLSPAGRMAAQSGNQEHQPAHVEADAATGPAGVVIPDPIVLDQDRHKVRFYSDLIKGKTVAIDFIFTTCSTICPPLTANFARLQRMMRERGEKDFHLISVSVDPQNDTPERLKNYAALFKAQPGWTFVTGSQAEMEQIWKAFSVYAGGNRADHSPTVVIGNEASRKWAFASGLTSADKLLNVVQSVHKNNVVLAQHCGAGGPCRKKTGSADDVRE